MSTTEFTYLSMRQPKYPLASLRHRSSLTPFCDLRHLMYSEIRCLHSPAGRTIRISNIVLMYFQRDIDSPEILFSNPRPKD